VDSAASSDVNSAQFVRTTEFGDPCSELPVTLYFTDPVPGPGTVLYTNSGLTTLVDPDFTIVLIVDTSIIYELSYGVIGAATGDAC
jgi:hypothetical protein